MQVGGSSYSSLKDFAVRAPINQEYADTLREQGQHVIQDALDIYANPERSIEQGRAAGERLTDLERAMKAVVDRNTDGIAHNEQLIGAKVGRFNNHEVVDGKSLQGPAQEPVENSPQTQVPGYNTYNVQVAKGRRVWGAEKAAAANPAKDAMEGVRAFIRDLHNVAGLYAAAVAIPGPAAVSVATFAREHADGQAQSSGTSTFSGASSSHSEKLLGLLGSSDAGSRMSGASVSSSSSGFSYDKTATDERIVPVMRDLVERLDQARISPATQSTIQGLRPLQEFRTDFKTTTTGFLHKETHQVENGETQLTWIPISGGGYGSREVQFPRALSQEEYQPARLYVPQTGISNY